MKIWDSVYISWCCLQVIWGKQPANSIHVLFSLQQHTTILNTESISVNFVQMGYLPGNFCWMLDHINCARELVNLGDQGSGVFQRAEALVAEILDRSLT